MKIDSSPKIPNDLPVGDATLRPGQGAAKASAPPPAGNQVSLSPTLTTLQSGGVGAGPEVFDTRKVEEIKSAISEGKFSIDTGKVADGLIDTVRNLLRGPKN